MTGNYLLLVLVLFPMAGAIISYCAGKKSRKFGDVTVIATAVIEIGIMLYVCFTGYMDKCSFYLGNMSFELDGFRCIYGVIVCFMWLIEALFSPEYMKSYHKRSRYYFFYLFTLGATMGVFLSADLFTTFMCFEIMSFTSYAWVAHEETPAALKAANTYLAVAVIGGLVALMGLFIVYADLGTLQISELYEAAKAFDNKAVLYVAGGCILFGFGAKAGMFPLHIWLPKAHPVAPAPASALLSGVLTKSGIFGILVITCNIFRYDKAWATVILTLGVITMVLGALLALFSIDLKRTLACSSLSQIGFILVGIGMMGFLGEENALAARGTVLHMINHSLIKLVLFTIAGVVYMNMHKLNLNDIRGFGRKKPLLNICFLIGAMGISGIPLFNGYISKTLLHESIVEYAEQGGAIFTVVEWIFLISGGLTLAYMTKLYIAIFVEKHPTKQAKMDSKKKYISPLSAFALCVATVILPILGILPNFTMDKLADLSSGFMVSGEMEHTMHYFSLESLMGAGISIVIGVVVYFVVVRCLLMKKQGDCKVYIDAWPKWLDLETLVYRPVLLKILPAFFGTICKAISDLPDAIVLLLRKFLFKDKVPDFNKKPHYRTAHALGEFMDKRRAKSNRKPKKQSYADTFVRINETIDTTTTKIMGNFSFALLMACIGICLTLIYLLFLR